ncbi:putative pyrroloquinoline-quinone binding quinoprotein [Motilibacter rhizosphaerae]|uniref:Putative pyrroloquinoline-quinone binding quinoprotein n=1 Tax=Motilibacter rhizosphaerae TaxID=598652 RepID=A0A4Q7NVN9_9ACTN|nr:PQQ-binding-like beta-propeller repeat protein [Motilibacter rhizosphaerae]RZS91333.1 putative pyrroloquinoline-quinone binding quinoprotein [Motilibacter rhizosphaerae]
MRRLLLLLPAALVACSSGGGSTHPAAPSNTSSSTSSSTSEAASAPEAASAVRDWPTYHGDLRRSGTATMPTPTKLAVRAKVRLDAAVYASPVVAAGITVVATEANSVYGLDGSGHQLWRARLGSPAKRSELPCGNIDPLGITGTPAYDKASGLVYLVAEHGSPVSHELVALSAKTGKVAWRKSVDLPGVETKAMQERGALTFAQGKVWVPFGGLAGDCGGYKGRVVGVPLDGKGSAVAYTVPTPREGGIWTPPGPSVDSAGNLYVAVGNGENGPGSAYDYSDSILQLRGTTLVGSYSPSTWAADNAADLDLGSQGPALVGSEWIFTAGKSGTAYVVRQRALGGIGAEVSSAKVCRSFGGTAVVASTVYVPCADGLRAVSIRSNGKLSLGWHAASGTTGSPVVAGNRVWSLDPGAGVLHALDPRSGRSLSQVAVGTTTRFATPAVRGTDLLVPTTSGLTIVRTR